MNAKQWNKLNMMMAVLSLCRSEREVWEGVAGFAKAFERFEDLVEKLNKDAELQETDTTGIAKDKMRAKEQCIVVTMQVGGALYVMAKEKGDIALMEEVRINKSTLDRDRDNICLQRCIAVLERAQEFAAFLEYYGVSEARLGQFENTVQKLAELTVRPRSAMIERMAATKSIRENVREIDDLLNNVLDRLVETFRETNLSFYNMYFTTRRVIHLGIKHTNLYLKVISKESETPVAGASLSLTMEVEDVPPKVLEGICDRRGEFSWKRIMPGRYVLKVSKEGFQDALLDVEIKRGKTVRMEVFLIEN